MVKSNATAELGRLIERGNYLQAIDTAQKELENNDTLEVRKCLALALSRSGSVNRAMNVLEPVVTGGGMDPETRALMAGILKRRWEITGDTDLLQQSYHHYLKAFRESGGYWAGINAATLAFVMDMKEAELLADEVLEICWDEYGRMGTRSSFWLLVSIAEGHLVKGDLKTALKWYRLVTPMSYKSVGKIRTVRRNARILGRKYGGDVLNEIRNAIHVPRVAFFAGHRIDRSGMATRFPMKDSDTVKKKLRTSLGKNRISVGVASLADGADILFHESLQEMGRQTRVILPSPVEDFRTRLASDDPGGWLGRFDAVLEKATAVETVSGASFERYSGDTYDLTADFMIGYAMNLAEELDGEMVPMVVWDRKRRNRKGGTYSAVRKLRKLGMEPEVIQLPGAANDSIPPVEEKGHDPCSEEAPFRSAIVVVGTGSCDSHQDKARRISTLMGEIKSIIRAGDYTILKKSMGYEEIYLIFQNVSQAVNFMDRLYEACPHCSIMAHVDFSLKFNDESAGSGQIYTPVLSDIVAVNRNMAPGDIFCTTGFRSLARYSGARGYSCQYAGSYAINTTREIGLFRMIPEVEDR